MKLPLRFALRYLFARTSHNVINIISGISVTGMAVGTAALIIVLSVYTGFNSLIEQSMGDVQCDLKVTPSEGKVFIPEGEAFEWAYANPGIKNISCVLEDRVFISYESQQKIARAKGVDTVFEEETPLSGHITEGKFELHQGTLCKCVMSAALAYPMGVSPRFVTPLKLFYPDRDSRISLTNPMASINSIELRPSGIFNVNTTLDGDLVIVPLESMRELLGYEEEVSALEIRLSPTLSAKQAKALEKELSQKLGDSFKVSDRYRQNASLYKMMRYEKLSIYLILIFIVIIIAFNVFSCMTMLIIEKQQDIATLSSLGAGEGTIRKIFILEGWLISLLGLVIGLVIGIGVVLLQMKTGMLKMPGGFAVAAYPVILKFTDIAATAAGVAAIGYLIALLPWKKQNKN